MAEITVKGTGKKKFTPDEVHVYMDLTAKAEEYGKVFSLISSYSDGIKNDLNRIGFSKDDVKTTDFRVDPQYEGYDENGVWKQRLVGYNASHSMSLVFLKDDEKLNQVLNVLAMQESAPSFRVEYELSHIDEAKDEVLSHAVTVSRRKAEILASAAERKVGEILSITYGWKDAGAFVPLAYGKSVTRAAVSNTAMDLTPEDIEIEEDVTVVFELL